MACLRIQPATHKNPYLEGEMFEITRQEADKLSALIIRYRAAKNRFEVAEINAVSARSAWDEAKKQAAELYKTQLEAETDLWNEISSAECVRV
jgi:hypothetical protein